MKIGLNMLLWTPHVTEEHFPLFSILRKFGYDGVELPIFGGDVAHYRKAGQAIKDAGLGCTVVSVIPDEAHNPISPDESHRRGAVEYLKWVIDCASAAGAEVVCGPLYQPLGVFSGKGPTESEKAWAADVHRQAAGYAAQAGIDLAIEPLNRFECYFLNTLGDAAQHAQRVNHPSLGIMYDTFHGNIEERDPVGCITENIRWMKHFHISSNDRGTPGKDHIPWIETFKALRRGGYDGWLTIESFGGPIEGLAATVKIWREISAGAEEVYRTGLETIRKSWKAAGPMKRKPTAKKKIVKVKAVKRKTKIKM